MILKGVADMSYSGYSMVDEFDARKNGFKKYLTKNVFLDWLHALSEEYDIGVNKLIMKRDNFTLSFRRYE